MKVNKETWNERMQNLIVRRSKEEIKGPPDISNYAAHLSKINIGKYVLDVGCGAMVIQKCLPKNTLYWGVDPFPINERVTKMEAEDLSFFDDHYFDTVFAFAMLDNVHDLQKVISEMKRVCTGNILILTGVDIVPDRYHTIMITEEILIQEMAPFKIGYREKLQEKILLIEFVR